MATNPLGSGVTRYITDRDRQFAAVIFQADKPPLDSEVNLISLIDLEARAEEVRSRVASGWLMDELNPRSDFTTSTNYSNQFYFGPLSSDAGREIRWAAVNGWLIPVCGTNTGAPPLAPNDSQFSNLIKLEGPTTLAGANRQDFTFLEVWLQRIDVDPPVSGVAPGKPVRGYVYRFGNVLSGFSYLPDELVDPDINYETTKRVQIQYRIRTVSGVSLVNNPEGFDPLTVFAQGPLTSATTLPFSNMRSTLGDPGLWRAGSGDPSTFGTVDGYVYAIPLCATFRRNSASFSDTNLAGAVNRNLSATAARTYTSDITLASLLSSSATSFTVSATVFNNSFLGTLNPYTNAYFKIDDEIIQVTAITFISPNYTINISRAQLGSVASQHVVGSKLSYYTLRPDGLFSDQVASTDILDLRHSVADKFDYQSILKTNLQELLRGNLRTTWKRYGATNVSGPVVSYGDYITASSTITNGLTRLDAPDGNRRTWSDAAVTQRFVVPVVVPPNNTVPQSVTKTVAPYGISALFSVSGQSTRTYGSGTGWFNGDKIKIPITSFTGSADARFILPSEIENAVVIRFDGMTTDPNGGTPGATSASATNIESPAFTTKVIKNGQGAVITLDVEDLLIELNDGGTAGAAYDPWVDSVGAAPTSAFCNSMSMFIEFSVLYEPGRGLSHRPSYVNTPKILNASVAAPNAVMLRQGGVSTTVRPMIPSYLGDSPEIQTGVNRTFAKTAEIMLDPGSKSVQVAPYSSVVIPNLLVRAGNKNNWYGTSSFTYQGCMPTKSIDGSATVWTSTDPLGLFDKTKAIEIPIEYCPKPGLHYAPIVNASGAGRFSQGLNFMLLSKGGSLTNTSDFNLGVVAYPSAPGYYIVTDPNGTLYNTVASASSAVYGKKYSSSKITNPDGSAFQGIQFPPFYGPARITGVYRRVSSAFLPSGGSPFNNNREISGGGTAVNLLRDSFDGATYLLDVDTNGDLFFVLNAQALDLTKASLSGSFNDYDYLVECTLFGYDRGFLQTNARICLTAASSPPGTGGTISVNAFLTSSDGVGLVTPAPIPSTTSVQVYYNAMPYQGDVFGSQSSYSDSPYFQGSLSIGNVDSLNNNPLGAPSTLSLPNKTGYEVLASMNFETTLGTGRLSGSNPIPLLNTTEAPLNPPDVAGTLVDVNRLFSLNRVGYQDWASQSTLMPVKNPATDPTLTFGALSEQYDNDVHPELAGSTVHLPLGAFFRDKDFVGKTMYQIRTQSGAAAAPVGAFTTVPQEAPQNTPSAGISTFEGTDFVCGNSSNCIGQGNEAIITVDGVVDNLTSTTVFKTTRGGAGYSASGAWPGGPLSARLPKARPNTEVGSVLMGKAYLVKSGPETVSGTEVHPGNELQMVVLTQATPAYFRDSEIVHSASGAGEGYTAIDRYRCLGHPLEKRRGVVNTNILPTARPLFVNKIFDNPLYWGSSDLPLVTEEQETVPVTINGQSLFSISVRPNDPTTVQMFVNGVKQAYGVDYTVGGTENKTVTYTSTTVALVTTDIVEFFYTTI